MSVTLLQNLSFGAFVAAAVTAVLAVALFFLLDVAEAYGIASGRTKRKAIARIQKQLSEQQAGTTNLLSEELKSSKTSRLARIRAPMTEEMVPKDQTSGNPQKPAAAETVLLGASETVSLEPQIPAASPVNQGTGTVMLGNSSDTVILEQEPGTLILNENPLAQTGPLPEITVAFERFFMGSAEIIE